MANLKERISRLVRSIPPLQAWYDRARFPGIALARGVSLDIRGCFDYGQSLCINTQAVLIVPEASGLMVGDHCYIGRHVEIGPDSTITIGNHTSIQDRSILLGNISLGAYCTLAPNVYISSGRHHYKLEPTLLIKDQDRLCASDPRYANEISRKVTIEDDCWLAINTVIMSGVSIGKGAVVGANSVVTHDVPPYCVVAGVPAKVISRRLDFAPPKAISWDCRSDRPYFYSGFQVSEAEYEANTATGGLVASGDFRIALDASEGDVVELQLKSLGAGQVSVCHAGEEKAIGPQWESLFFRVGGDGLSHNNILLFTQAAQASPIAVRKAAIQ